MCVWDLESLAKERTDKTQKTDIVAEHWLASYGVAMSYMNDTPPKHKERVRGIHQTEKELIKLFFLDLLSYHKDIVLFNMGIHYDKLLALKQKIESIVLPPKKKKESYNLTKKRKRRGGLQHYYKHYIAWIINVPVYGFNNSRFDVHFIKRFLPIFDDTGFLTDHLQNILGKEKVGVTTMRVRIEGYRIQDIERFGRACGDKEKYVTVDWVLGAIEAQKEAFGGKLCCSYCQRTMTTEPTKQKQNNLLTLDRIDNSQPHSIKPLNILLACLHCNCHAKIGMVAKISPKILEAHMSHISKLVLGTHCFWTFILKNRKFSDNILFFHF